MLLKGHEEEEEVEQAWGQKEGFRRKREARSYEE